MSLFGNLRSLPLEELLQLLAHKEGALEIWNAKDIPATTIYLKPGRIRSLDQGGEPLDPPAAKATLQALLLAREGGFEFIPGAVPRHRVRLNWPLERVLLGFITLHDELERHRAHLPHPRAVYRATGHRAPWRSDPRLEAFFRQALPALREGIHAEALAQRLGMPLDLVRYGLFRLEKEGLVERVGRWEGGGRGFWERLFGGGSL